MCYKSELLGQQVAELPISTTTAIITSIKECSEGNFDDKIMNVIQQQFTGLM